MFSRQSNGTSTHSNRSETLVETSSRASSRSGTTAKSESTQKARNQTPSPRSILNLNTSNGSANNMNKDRVSASSPTTRNLFGKREGSKEDKKIAAYIVKLKDVLAAPEGDTARVSEILTKIRMLLDVRVERGDKSPLAAEVDLGPTIVEVMRHHSSNSQLMEEATCILYFVSVLDPSFKKGVARMFKSMAEHKSNVAIQRASCEAIRNVVQANPDSLARIAPSLGVIVQSMSAHATNHKLIFKSLELLADLALEPGAKTLFVQKGGVGLLHVLSAMDKHANDPSIQAAGCRCITNISLGANIEITQRMAPCIDALLRAMNRHTSHKHVQLYGCWALGNLATSHHAEIVRQGAIDAILPTMRENLNDVRLQEQGCASLYKIVTAAQSDEVKQSYVQAITMQEGIPAFLQCMTTHAQLVQIQIYGLGVLLACVSHSLDHHEMMLAEGGLDVIFRALTTFETNVDVAITGMELLKNFTRQSLDFQRAVFAKGGIGIVVNLMKVHRQAHTVQDPAFATLRNIAIHPENRMTVAQQGGIPIMTTNMEIYIGDAAIQAYGCDALGRLALEAENQLLIIANRGIDTALAAMQSHPNHPGVQDRSIFLLLSLSENEDAVTMLKEMNALESIKQARIPQKEAAMERCEKLIKALENRGSWFGRK
eukprot:Nitzschia sp. Nitz4//scaffold5_size260463//208004//209971//NITZ4_001014-RA/size260463-processed-gene-0.95-mRNA-1//1//CDS//3329555436//3919//frame0